MIPSWLLDAGLFYCAAVWGATFYMIKDALATIDPIILVSYRFLLSAAFIAPWALRRKNPLRLLKEGALLSLLLTALYVSQTIGLRYTSASNSGFITGLFVVLVPIFLLVFFRKPPAPAQWIAVALSAAGLWLLTGGASRFNRGDALTLIAAATYAGHLLITDGYVKGDADTLLLAFHQFWMTGILCLAIAAAAGSSFVVRSRGSAGFIAFLALVPTLSAFFIQMEAQRKAPPVKVALVFSLEPVFAALFAWTLGGEMFRPAAAVGGGLIVSGMIVSEFSKLPLLKSRRKEILPV